VQGKAAQAALQEARGFTATVPTTQLIRGKKAADSGKANGNDNSAATGSSMRQQKQYQ